MDAKHLPPITVRNDAGETAPAYGVAEISGSVETDGEHYLTVRKPTGSGEIVVIGPSSIAAGGWGQAFRGAGPFALFTGSTPMGGTTLNATSGSWALSDGGTGAAAVAISVGGASPGTDKVRVVLGTGGTPGSQGPPGVAGNPGKTFRLLTARQQHSVSQTFTGRAIDPVTRADLTPTDDFTIYDLEETFYGPAAAAGIAYQATNGQYHVASLDDTAPLAWLTLVRHAGYDEGTVNDPVARATVATAPAATNSDMLLHGHSYPASGLYESYDIYTEGVGVSQGSALPIDDPRGYLAGVEPGDTFLAGLFRTSGTPRYQPLTPNNYFAIAKLTGDINSGTPTTTDFEDFEAWNHPTAATPAELVNDLPVTAASGDRVRLLPTAGGWRIVAKVELDDRKVALDAADQAPGQLLDKVNLTIEASTPTNYHPVKATRSGDVLTLIARDTSGGGGPGTDELVKLNPSDTNPRTLEELLDHTINDESVGNPGSPALTIERTSDDKLRFIGNHAASYSCWVEESVNKVTSGTLSAVTVRLRRTDPAVPSLVDDASTTTAYWDSLSIDISIPTGKRRQGHCYTTPEGVLMLNRVDCTDHDAP